MTTGESGRARKISPKEAAKLAKNQRYRERLAGHEVDAYPERLDTFIGLLNINHWYPRPLPEGKSPTYWRGEASWEESHNDEWWNEHKNDDMYVLARRELVKLAFTYLKVREQLAFALWYGLLDGNLLPSKTRRTYVAEQMEVSKDLAGQLVQHALSKLHRICSLIAEQPSRFGLDDADPRIVLHEGMGFSCRTYNCLQKVGLRTLKDLTGTDANEFMNIRGFGKACLTELCQKLREWDQPLPKYAERYIDIENL